MGDSIFINHTQSSSSILILSILKNNQNKINPNKNLLEAPIHSKFRIKKKIVNEKNHSKINIKKHTKTNN